MKKWSFTSESVSEGHPDKVADQISDAILDAFLEQDCNSHVGCETLITTGLAVIAGEISSKAHIDIPRIVRDTVKSIGYDQDGGFAGFDGGSCAVMVSIDEQSPDIAMGLSSSEEVRAKTDGLVDPISRQGAGDQGMMFGFACDETEELMPITVQLAHRLAEQQAAVRRSGVIPYLCPDAKTLVSFDYEDHRPVRLRSVLVSTQHRDGIDRDRMIIPDLMEQVISPVIPEQFADDDYKVLVNPTGKFVRGGPVADAGLTGRKIIVDTYGGVARHGGGAFSGKDPSKMDRSASYAARWVAKNIVACGAASRCELQVSYAIGVAEPFSFHVETFGTEKVEHGRLVDVIKELFDFRPAAIIRDLDLLRPIYKETSVYGHFGRCSQSSPHGPLFTWEITNRVDQLKSALDL